MVRDLDDIEHERLVARILCRPEPPCPTVEAATLLAARPGRECSTPAYLRNGKDTCLCLACRARRARKGR